MAFLQIEHKFFRTKEYLDFLRKPESTTYYFLRTAIIRENKTINFSCNDVKYIYYNYFNEGKLVSRYPQKLIGEYMGIGRTGITKHIKALVKAGFIKVHIRKVKDGVANYYEFGKWEGNFGTSNYKENYYLDDYFMEIYNKEKENKYGPSYESEASLYPTAEEYIFHKRMEKGEPLTIEEIEILETLWRTQN